MSRFKLIDTFAAFGKNGLKMYDGQFAYEPRADVLHRGYGCLYVYVTLYIKYRYCKALS
jgi:hypothetical protein